MAQGGFELLKRVAAAHLHVASVQEKLCGALSNLAANDGNNPNSKARSSETRWVVGLCFFFGSSRCPLSFCEALRDKQRVFF